MKRFVPDRDTHLGDGPRGFPSTCWSRIVDAKPGGLEGRGALEELARQYWKPVYIFIRRKWARSNEDAKDLSQGFFMWMMESDFLSKADRTRGRFRQFLRVAVEHFVGGEARKLHAAKRGGRREQFVIDEKWIEGKASPADPALSPEQEMDLAWKTEVFSRALPLLREKLKQEGKEIHFTLFSDYCIDGPEGKDYAQLARKYGLRETDVDNHLRHARRRFRGIITRLVEETVSSEADLKEELKSLFGDSLP